MEAKFEHDCSFLVVGGRRFQMKSWNKNKRLLKRLAKRGDITSDQAKSLKRQLMDRFRGMVRAIQKSAGIIA